MKKKIIKSRNSKPLSISMKVKIKVDRIKEGSIFSAKDLYIDGSISAIEMALSRMVKSKKIVKVGKGLFSKPKKTRFGQLDFTQDGILKYAEKNTKLISTSHSVFNKLGITTQVPAKQIIKVRKKSTIFTTENNKFIKIKVNKNLVSFSSKDAKLVEILEALTDMKNIFDASPDDVINKISTIIHKLTKTEIVKLCDLALKYRPSVRAVIGAIIENIEKTELDNLSKFIKRSLNPKTKYKLGITEKSLQNRKEWNIS